MKKYFLLKNYIFRYLYFKKKIKIFLLSKKKLPFINLSYFNYKINIGEKNISNLPFTDYNVLGVKINLENIKWQKDEVSSFEYPLVRLDKLKISKYFDKGIDFLIPWVKSRFHFLFALAAAYSQNGQIFYYNKFKSIILDWEIKNPFLYGIQWFPPMDLSIGSANLIFAINTFSDLIDQDPLFKKKLSEMLVKRGEYLNRFIEVYENKHTTNHTTTDYAGLFFISLALKDHPNSKNWFETSIEGIVNCMEYQVNDDGGAFEASIFYHRLVLEIFGLFTVFAISYNISVPKIFIIKLFKMFEYTASYMDTNGNAPKFGDCDSGRFMIMDDPTNSDFYEIENNHLYLLQLGEYIFNHQFGQDYDNEFKFDAFLPTIKRIELDSLKITPRNSNKSISFKNSGLFVLKNQTIHLALACFPMGQNGRGGHNHYDFGSFTLSINGIPFIVDPGEYQYTRDKDKRNKFRSYQYHNTLSNSWDLKNIEKENQDHFKWWGIHDLYTTNVKDFQDTSLEIEINRVDDKFPRRRKFKISTNSFILQDKYENEFISTFNFHPDIDILATEESKIITNLGEIHFNNFDEFKVETYEFAPYYGSKVSSKSLKIFSNKVLETSFLIT